MRPLTCRPGWLRRTWIEWLGGVVANKVGARKNLGAKHAHGHAFSYVATRVAPSALFASELHLEKLLVAAKGNKLARAAAELEPHKWQKMSPNSA